MSRNVDREIIFHKNYFQDFYFKLDIKSKDKIKHILDLVKYLEIIPGHYMKLIRSSEKLYEIRISARNKSIRIMSFIDRNDTIVILNCFFKKTRKIPRNEIILSEKLKNEYLNEKNRN